MKKENKIYDDEILELLRAEVIKEFKSILKTNTHCKLLVDDIFEKTGRSVGNTTIRRFFGLDRTANKPSFYTLDTLSQYAGFTDFEHFLIKKKEKRKTILQKEDKTSKEYDWDRFKSLANDFSLLNYKIIKNEINN